MRHKVKQLITAHTGGAGVGYAVTHFWMKDLAGAAGTALVFADITGINPVLHDTQCTQSQIVIVADTGMGHTVQLALPRIATRCICISVTQGTITVCGAAETAHSNGAATPVRAPRPAQHCA